MPELPEVEASRRFMERHCLGKVVKHVHAEPDEKVFCGHSQEEIQKAFQGKKILSISRKGKYFWAKMSGERQQALFHFGMTGHLLVRYHGHPYTELKDNETWPPRFTKLELVMDDGTQIVFTDARRFAKIKLVGDPPRHEPIKSLGPDAYTAMPPVVEFAKMLMARRRPIKALLIDQSFLSGIGNWVADEVMYQARIFPETRGDSVTEAQAELIHIAICYVLKTAVEAGANSENFPSSWLFHYRWTGKVASKTANGEAIRFLTVGGRTTAYVPELQAKPVSASENASRSADGKASDLELFSSHAETAVSGKKRDRQHGDREDNCSPCKHVLTGNGPGETESKATTPQNASTGNGNISKSSRPVRECRKPHAKAQARDLNPAGKGRH